MVDGLERELEGRAQVIRLNVAEPVGREAEDAYATSKVPAIIVLDGAGNEVYRTEGKLPRKRAIREALGMEPSG